MYSYETILRSLEAAIPETCARQVMARGRPDVGAFISAELGCPVPTHGAHTHDLARACYVYLAE